MSTQDSDLPSPPDQTMTEAFLGAGFFERPWVKRLRSQSDTVRLVLLVGLFAGALYLPLLGERLVLLQAAAHHVDPGAGDALRRSHGGRGSRLRRSLLAGGHPPRPR